MRIAILADPLDNQNAGVHIFTKSLIAELANSKDSHSYLIIRQKFDPNLPKRIKQIVVPLVKFPGFASLRLFFNIPYILNKEKVDVVIEPAHFGPFNLKRNIKRVTVIHDLTPIKFPEYHQWIGQTLQRIFLKRILRQADLVITNSLNTSQDLELYYPFTKNKNTPIHLGKDDAFQPIKDKKVLSNNGLMKPYFLSVGTIEPRKNLVLLLDAFEQFSATKDEDIDLVIVGGMGWKTKDFEDRLDAHAYRNRIILLGYVDKDILPALYTQSIAMIYPSLYEGFGFPILEAMSCGAPVICSNNSSLPEVGGDVAHYIDPTSQQSLVEQMDAVFRYTPEKREKLKALSLSQSNKFSWKKFASQFVQELERL